MTPYFERDGIVIYHGDCREVLPTIEPSSVDLLLADPPYGVREKTNRATRLSSAPVKARTQPTRHVWAPIAGDDGPFDPSHLLGFDAVILWGANHYADRLPPSAAWLVWDKREGSTSDDNADCEMAWTSLRGPARLFSHLWRGMAMRGEENGRRKLHPTQKPVALMSWCLKRAGITAGSLVVSPYLGSGPEVEACRRVGARLIGIEVSEAYCEIAARRLDQLTLFGSEVPA